MIVDQFLHWMESAPLESRCRAVAALARSLLICELDDHDRQALEATLTVLLDDPEPAIRLTIAEELAGTDLAPHHLILTLIDAAPETAAVVLARSPLLLEAELVDIVAQGNLITQTAIATRRWLTPSVAAALAEVGELEACVTLVCNQTASIPQFSLMTLADRFGADDRMREAMLVLPHLPITVRQLLLARQFEQQSSVATVDSWLEEERAEAIVLEARERTTVYMAALATADDLTELVEHLRITHQLTTSLLLRAVTLGDMRFLAEALVVLSGMPRGRVEALLSEGRETSCRALLLKAGIPARAVPTFLVAIEVQRDLRREMGHEGHIDIDDHRFAQRVLERVLTLTRSSDPDEFDDLVVLLRRYATDAARDAARSFVSRMTRGTPVSLPAPAARLTYAGGIDFETAVAA